MLCAAVAAILSAWVDTQWLPQSSLAGLAQEFPFNWGNLRGVLSITAGAFLGVAGVSFSITIASLSLASQQFGPRLIRTFMQNRFTQVVLGFFVATYLYCIVILQLIAVDTEGLGPPVTTAISLIVLTVIDLLLLVSFIHHICVAIQADTVVADVSDELRERSRSMYSPSVIDGSVSELHNSGDRIINTQPQRVATPSPGYVQTVDYEQLLQHASDTNTLIEVYHRAGDYLVDEETMCMVYARDSGSVHEDTVALCRRSLVLGRTRTPVQDSEYSIRQLVEIALRALSPGVNDPFTAIHCIDHLGSALVSLSEVSRLKQFVYDDQGQLRLVLNVTCFEGLVNAAFDQIRQCSNGNIAIQIRLLEIIEKSISVITCPQQIESLYQQAALLVDAAELESMPESDAKAIRERFQQINQARK